MSENGLFMRVGVITIEGENVIISAETFDLLQREAGKAKKLTAVAEAAERVTRWTWTDIDDEPLRDMQALEKALEAL